MSSTPPMCGWPEPCDNCSDKNKRCYCYRVNLVQDGTIVGHPAEYMTPAEFHNHQYPEGD